MTGEASSSRVNPHTEVHRGQHACTPRVFVPEPVHGIPSDAAAATDLDILARFIRDGFGTVIALGDTGEKKGRELEARIPGPDLIAGRHDDEFGEVADVFRNQIARTDGGASVAVYHRGRLVVDLWRGVRSLAELRADPRTP